jgi:DNA-binding NtrC family response regulator
MKRKIKILVAEDSPVDALLITHALESEFPSMDISRASCRASFGEALNNTSYDIILCDHFMNDFTSLEALEKVKNTGSDVQFIVVTNHNDHNLATSVIDKGAYDYVLKSDLFRLPTAVKNALNYSGLKKELEELRAGK